MAMARAVPEDPHCGLADEGLLASRFPDLDICEPEEPAPETLADRAGRAEDAARAVPGDAKDGVERMVAWAQEQDFIPSRPFTEIEVERNLPESWKQLMKAPQEEA